jgi:hypothetical protein
MMKFCDELSGHPLRPYQRPFAQRIFESLVINDGATITALFSRQAGKSLDTDTPMLTPSGWRTMGDLQIGDLVFAADGTPAPVTAVSEVFTDHPCYLVRFADGQEIVADAGHLWTLRDCQAKRDVTITTEEIAGREKYGSPSCQYYRYRVALPGPVEMPDQELPLDPYLLGLWLGDGSSSKAEITTADLEVVEAFRRAGFPTSYQDSRRTGRATTYGFLGGLYAILKSMDLIKNYRQGASGFKHVPSRYLLASPNQRLALLRGLMDSDGYADAKRGSVEFCSIIQELAVDVLFLARSLGWKAVLREDRAKLNGKDCGPRFRVGWHPYRSFSPFSLDRKSSRLHERSPVEFRARRTESIPIVSATRTETVPVKCIAIDHPSHLYLAGTGLVPTHNTECVANTMATAMILLPRLAKVYPNLLDKFREGVWVGAFAPTDLQAATLYARIVSRLTSDHATELLHDPEIDDRVIRIPRGMALKNCGSIVIKNTAHPRAKIESQTFHVLLVDECQEADNIAIDKSVCPMGTETNSTNIWTGTPSYTKNVFYRDIQTNKREQLRRGARKNHFEVPWTVVARHSPNYKKKVLKELLKMGEDSHEFQLSYNLTWMLDKGMFTGSQKLEELADKSMPYVLREYFATPVVAGIDCARIKDRTVVTVVLVDWDNPDPAGFVHHRILNWLDLEGMDWEEQYFRITEFLSRYNIWKVGVDHGGLGDAVIDRLRRLMPHIEFVAMDDGPAEQSRRWKYLKQLMDRNQIAWPGGAKVRELRTWKRFIKEMEDLQIEYKGPNLKAFAPNETNAHDDYPDSLAMACVLSQDAKEDGDDFVVTSNFFYNSSM